MSNSYSAVAFSSTMSLTEVNYDFVVVNINLCWTCLNLSTVLVKVSGQTVDTITAMAKCPTRGTHWTRCSSAFFSSASLLNTDRMISCSSFVRKLRSIMMTPVLCVGCAASGWTWWSETMVYIDHLCMINQVRSYHHLVFIRVKQKTFFFFSNLRQK